MLFCGRILILEQLQTFKKFLMITKWFWGNAIIDPLIIQKFFHFFSIILRNNSITLFTMIYFRDTIYWLFFLRFKCFIINDRYLFIEILHSKIYSWLRFRNSINLIFSNRESRRLYWNEINFFIFTNIVHTNWSFWILKFIRWRKLLVNF